MARFTKKQRLEHFFNVRVRCLPFFYKTYRNRISKDNKIRVIGMIRERNEELLLQDSLDHLAQFVDGIVVFDDASTDNSVDIAKKHPSVLEVIVNRRWKKNTRIWEETANRKLLYQRAKKYNPEWFFYADADERFEGDIKNFLLNECPQEITSIKISLLDAYITKEDCSPYHAGNKLYNFRKYFGIERRDIIMIWRNHQGADFIRQDAREPQGLPTEGQIVKFHCQHYGKSLSIEHWEETCRYYADHFPKYSEKWRARMGKAVHEKSDFDTNLMTWEQAKLNSRPL